MLSSGLYYQCLPLLYLSIICADAHFVNVSELLYLPGRIPQPHQHS
jgi:hypothetical protein